MFWMEHILYKALVGFGIVAVALWAADGKIPYVFQPSGLHGVISNVIVLPLGETQPLPAGFVSPDLDLHAMAAWSLRVLRKNPRPNLDYEPVFFVRPRRMVTILLFPATRTRGWIGSSPICAKYWD
jgi:hypothetical protein